MLQDRLKFFGSVFDAMPVAVFVVDADVRILHLNATATAWLGQGEDPVFMLRGGEVFHCIHSTETPEGCGHSASCRECVIRSSVQEAMGAGKVFRTKARVQLRQRGKVADVHLLITTSPFTHEEKPLALLILEDISELIQLRSLLPICANCKKIRNDADYWEHVESYFQARLGVDFSHSVCPECLRTLYPDLLRE
ncbi:MAG TPA: PAS domain S-box protein [Candidatus Acidoferrum sp.]|nr:PAS domain S-box protein [Candidatus Acidoferrum sp.]